MPEKTTVSRLVDEIAKDDNVSSVELGAAVEQRREQKQLAELQIKQTRFLEKVRKEQKVPVSVSPQYNAEFGNNMRVTINGISIFIPIDGRQYMVPQTFADEIMRRVHKVNQKLNRFKRRGNDNNVVLVEERSIGEVKLS